MNASANFTGWRLVMATAAILCLGFAIILFTIADDVDIARAMIRYTARVSFLLFLGAFLASAVWRLWPGSFTQWLRMNRRYVGLSFALSHFTHLAAILTLANLDAALFATLTRPASIVLGGLAYVILAMMVATSFDRTARLLKPNTWSLLHTVGSYYFLLIFGNSFISRAVSMPIYIVPAIAVISALLIRLSARRLRPQPAV
jgi:sulfoxide reductase heme-binding subunit YedZ